MRVNGGCLAVDQRWPLLCYQGTFRRTNSDLHTRSWPDPDDPRLMEGLRARGKGLYEGPDYATVMGVPGRVFSLGQRLCGFEDWLVNLVANPKFARALFDTAREMESQMVKNMLGEVGDNVDVVMCADDLGMQNALVISPELYHKMMKPRHKRLFDATRSHTKANLLPHSDEVIAPVIGDLIDVGVDVRNPVQVSAVGMGDTNWLKKEFDENICFRGAIDTHYALPFGTPEKVGEEVWRRIEDLAAGGGYVLASVHSIQAEVPPENTCAMFKAAKEYGKYERDVFVSPSRQGRNGEVASRHQRWFGNRV